MGRNESVKQCQVGLTPLQKTILTDIAFQLGLTYMDNFGRGGEVGSLTKLVRSIAEGRLPLVNPEKSEVIKVVKFKIGDVLSYDLEYSPIDLEF